MAAAIIPIITAAAPIILPIIKSLVLHVEHLFGGGGTGAMKFMLVTEAVTNVANQLSTAGKIPGVLDPASIASMIESVVQELKSVGVLTPEVATAIVKSPAVAQPTATPAGPEVLQIVGGTISFNR